MIHLHFTESILKINFKKNHELISHSPTLITMVLGKHGFYLRVNGVLHFSTFF
jgi:hypothetical protein